MARLRRPSAATLVSLAAVVAVLATLAFVHDVVKKSFTTSSPPSADAQAPAAVTPLRSLPGCDGSLTSAAIARTDASLVTICVDSNGNYTYRGVRLSDGATLDVPAEATGARGFVARNDGVTYSLSNQQLVITAGDTVVRREPVIEYKDQHSG